MDNTKYERIRDFVNSWGYKAEEVNAYIRQVAPKLEFGAKKAKHDAMNAFLAGLLSMEAKPGARTPIPEPTTKESTGLPRDIWLMLGTGPDALTLEDVADYYAEYTFRMADRRETEAPSSMNFSKMIYAMDAEERQQQSCTDLIERHERITAPANLSMSDFIRNMHTEVDSTPHTIKAPDINTDENADINVFLSRLH